MKSVEMKQHSDDEKMELNEADLKVLAQFDWDL